MTDEEKARPMTTLTLLAFLPTWFKFYVVRRRGSPWLAGWRHLARRVSR